MSKLIDFPLFDNVVVALFSNPRNARTPQSTPSPYRPLCMIGAVVQSLDAFGVAQRGNQRKHWLFNSVRDEQLTSVTDYGQGWKIMAGAAQRPILGTCGTLP
ncbi:hypothetical protein J6590_013673 [Homalodisca vitripennis]|nr:hypothetical protein J6590_013673 [Homalodisca vitripennis]